MEDVLKAIKGKIRLNIELKTNGHEKEPAERTLAIVKNSDFLDDCIFTSFDLAQIKKIKKIDSCAKVGLIIKSLLKNIDIFSEDIEVLSAHYSLVRKDFVNSPKKMVKRYMSGL